MPKVHLHDLSNVRDELSGEDCGGGYAEPFCIHVDSRLSEPMQDLVCVHETIEEFKTHSTLKIRHDEIDHLAVAIIDCLKQLRRQQNAD